MLQKRRKIIVYIVYILVGIGAYFLMREVAELEHYRVFIENLRTVTVAFVVGNMAEHAKDFIQMRRDNRVRPGDAA
jgi:hypothetical protein